MDDRKEGSPLLDILFCQQLRTCTHKKPCLPLTGRPSPLPAGLNENIMPYKAAVAPGAAAATKPVLPPPSPAIVLPHNAAAVQPVEQPAVLEQSTPTSGACMAVLLL